MTLNGGGGFQVPFFLVFGWFAWLCQADGAALEQPGRMPPTHRDAPR